MSSPAILDVAAVGGAAAPGLMQGPGYSNDRRRERLVGICRGCDFLKRTSDAHVNKQRVRARPDAVVRISFGDLARMAGLAST